MENRSKISYAFRPRGLFAMRHHPIYKQLQPVIATEHIKVVMAFKWQRLHYIAQSQNYDHTINYTTPAEMPFLPLPEWSNVT